MIIYANIKLSYCVKNMKKAFKTFKLLRQKNMVGEQIFVYKR